MKISLQVCRKGLNVCPTRVDRSLISRATVLRPRRRRSVLRLVDGVGDLNGEPLSRPILIVTATGTVDSVDGEVVYGVPSHTTCHSTSAHLTIVAVVATQRRTAGHGPAHRPLSSLLAERPYSLVEPAPLDDGRPAGRLNLR